MDACTLIEIGTAIYVPVALAATVLFFSGREKLGVALMAPSWILLVFPTAKYLLTNSSSMSCEAALNTAALGVAFFSFLYFSLIFVALATSR